MRTLRAASALIGEIYEASSEPENWVRVLELLSKQIQADSATIIYRDFENPEADFSLVHTNQSPEECAQMVEEYENYYHKLDPMWKLAAKHTQIGIAIADSQLGLSREEYEAQCPEEYLENYMRRYDRWYVGGSYLFQDEDKALVIAVQRGINSVPWTDEEMGYLTDMSQHFQRAFRLHREFVHLRSRENQYKACINRLLMGVIIIKPDGKISFMNELAKRILSYSPVLTNQNGKLKALSAKNDEKLQNLLTKAIQTEATPKQTKTELVTAFSLKTDVNSSPLPMLVMPVEREIGYQGTAPDRSLQGNDVAIFFADPERSQQYSQDVISKFYGLTKAEAGVAIAISNGFTVAEYAKFNSVTPNTVRYQIKQIFQKLDISRQAELVKLLLQTPNIDLNGNDSDNPVKA